MPPYLGFEAKAVIAEMKRCTLSRLYILAMLLIINILRSLPQALTNDTPYARPQTCFRRFAIRVDTKFWEKELYIVHA